MVIKDKIFKEIFMNLSVFKTYIDFEVKCDNGDILKSMEDIFKDLFNERYNYNLKNMNEFTPNYPAIDLMDADEGVAYQITIRNDLTKVKDTITLFEKHIIGKNSNQTLNGKIRIREQSERKMIMKFKKNKNKKLIIFTVRDSPKKREDPNTYSIKKSDDYQIEIIDLISFLKDLNKLDVSHLKKISLYLKNTITTVESLFYEVELKETLPRNLKKYREWYNDFDFIEENELQKTFEEFVKILKNLNKKEREYIYSILKTEDFKIEDSYKMFYEDSNYKFLDGKLCKKTFDQLYKKQILELSKLDDFGRHIFYLNNLQRGFIFSYDNLINFCKFIEDINLLKNIIVNLNFSCFES